MAVASQSTGQTRFSPTGNRPVSGPTAAAIGAAVTLGLFALSTEDGPILCPFRRCTGGYCPGCGLTRSGGRLLRGDLAGSWQQHPYLIFGLAQAVLVAAVWRFGSARGRELLRSKAVSLLVINAVAITAVWVFRMVDGSIPVPFS